MPTEFRGVAQSGSALHWGCKGRRFKSCRPDSFREERPTLVHVRPTPRMMDVSSVAHLPARWMSSASASPDYSAASYTLISQSSTSRVRPSSADRQTSIDHHICNSNAIANHSTSHHVPQASKSLKHRQLPLANASHQLEILGASGAVPRFMDVLHERNLPALTADGIDILQVNVGKLCNMTCRHCHVDAGPDRREIMTRETIDQCLDALRNSNIRTIDLTGGAPEMNPDFRYFVTEARRLGVHVIDRCNLTILLVPGYEDLPQFLADNKVEIVASLPCYLPQNTNLQRGDGAYDLSLRAIRQLNELGYGMSRESPGSPTSHRPDTAPVEHLKLTLVFNPVGPVLPPDQSDLEQKYRTYLKEQYDIHFDRLFTITNMPISRFLEDLLSSGKYESYMQTLIEAFNPSALPAVMCRKMISVGWDGHLFDCDFNQMLELSPQPEVPQHIRDFDAHRLGRRRISTSQHCFGCTAAAGSGCHGAISNNA